MSKVTQSFLICPSIDELIPENHEYRKFLSLIDFEELCIELKSSYSHLGRKGYEVSSGIKMLVLQWMHDLSDRELEKHIKFDISAKFLCGFGMTCKTPDHSYFGYLRERIGTIAIARIFNKIGKSLRSQGLVSDIFTFVDSTALVTKGALWKERDKAIANREENLNNENVGNYASDKDARYGCKGKSKYWFGYKNHSAVDMKHGFITKTAATAANVSDAKGLKHVCPKQGAVVADKGYCTKPAQKTIKANGCHDMTIKNNNMKIKNKYKDNFISRLRSPYENVFSKMQKRARYKTIKKVQFQCFMEAITFNIKRLVSINAPPLEFAI